MTSVERTLLFISRSLQASLLATLIIAAISGLWLAFFANAVALAASFLSVLLERNWRVHLPVELDLGIVAFVYATLFLGTAGAFYHALWWWDLLLHAVSGAVLGVAGFLALYTLYVQHRIVARPALLAIFTFSFAVALGTVWEIFEFAADQLFQTDFQKSGLDDTMWDLIVDSAGALAAAIIGYWYVRARRAQGVFARLIIRFFERNPELGDLAKWFRR